ncbi:NUDIX domain-containing protein [Micromonospora inositola]|uniref:8-oxo-dGTP pyrophosphatase MutT, NUDIX family n=1 Tax=Micromonospora inositola TaxID=47865 RepID=A0A1C5IU38_9ACTN|nr:NUDIX domain-containing protein [Micromonospora inositola]SCG61840.1 8-oxo-dGTP pyrophosphatase MutT, NUDIX family [Micromonospora inositola]
MTSTAQTAMVDVFLVLRDGDGRVLFGLRAADLYAGGQWNLVSGKADEGEDVITAVLREAREEVGITLSRADLTPAGVVHLLPGTGTPRVGFGFHAVHDPARHGLAVNAEPDKCDELRWAAPDTPPQPFERYNAAVLAVSRTENGFMVVRWSE